MAARKGVIVTETVSNSEEMAVFLAKDGLCVIDVYQAWCGPCKPVQVLFKRLKTDIGADKIQFAMAECDKMKELEIYRGSCEPLFLFYGGGQLVGMVQGCNAPIIENMAIQKAEQEELIAQGKATRVVLNSTESVQALQSSQSVQPEQSEAAEMEPTEHQTPSGDNEEKEETLEPEEVVTLEEKLSDHHINKCFTIAVLNPENTANADAVNSMMTDLKMVGLTIAEQDKRTLTEDEVRKLHTGDVSDDIIAKMTSGDCLILALTKGETGASSLNLTSELILQLDEPNYVSSTIEKAADDVNFLFPDFVIPRVALSEQLRQQMDRPEAEDRTLTIITPVAYAKFAAEIRTAIEDLSFCIAEEKEYTFTEETAAKYFEFQDDLASDPALIESLCSGACLVLLLEKKNAVIDWRAAIGPYQNATEEAPESFRAKYNVDGAVPLLASSNASQATREVEFFFGT